MVKAANVISFTKKDTCDIKVDKEQRIKQILLLVALFIISFLIAMMIILPLEMRYRKKAFIKDMSKKGSDINAFNLDELKELMNSNEFALDYIQEIQKEIDSSYNSDRMDSLGREQMTSSEFDLSSALFTPKNLGSIVVQKAFPDGSCGYHSIMDGIYDWLKDKNSKQHKNFFDKSFGDGLINPIVIDYFHGKALKVLNSYKSYGEIPQNETAYLNQCLRIMSCIGMFKKNDQFCEFPDEKYTDELKLTKMMNTKEWIGTDEIEFISEALEVSIYPIYKMGNAAKYTNLPFRHITNVVRPETIFLLFRVNHYDRIIDM
ncbi:hypothetical protein ECANGB1_855 [Enterospora canceri]|uniref:OTU domain-containing protein n=1 Tax=Enterospora canceri TaxID=1081671 RepID=A0A1Y1S780_9MICR|nr:hypothetical protein ECANGB1_855 [Enterospora canceri]